MPAGLSRAPRQQIARKSRSSPASGLADIELEHFRQRSEQWIEGVLGPEKPANDTGRLTTAAVSILGIPPAGDCWIRSAPLTGVVLWRSPACGCRCAEVKTVSPARSSIDGSPSRATEHSPLDDRHLADHLHQVRHERQAALRLRSWAATLQGAVNWASRRSRLPVQPSEAHLKADLPSSALSSIGRTVLSSGRTVLQAGDPAMSI